MMLLAATALWLAGSKMFYLAFLALTLGIATTPLFYKFIFKPTTKEIATRIDELGLEERIITMAELDGDESYIAKRQREDAINSLKSISEKLLKIVISIPMALVLGVSTALGGGMTTVAALSSAGIIDNGTKIVEVIKNEKPALYTIEYSVEGDGEIEGDIIQNIENGKNGSMVIAVALPGNVFYMWSDGLEDPVRYESRVKENIEVTAIFIELEEDDESEQDGEEGNESGDPEQPKEPKPGEGENSDGGGGGTGGNPDDQTRKWGDGKKDLGDYLDQARDDASKGAEGKDNDTRKKVDDYFNGLN